MKQPFAFTRTRLAILLTLFGYPTWAIEPFPALPPTLSTSVTPNIMLYIDTSGSMLQSSSNGWMRNDLCTMTDATWANCVNKNTNKYRSTIDDPNESPNTKMNIAKRVAKNIINDNRNLRFGLFTFQDNPENIGGSERAQAGKLRRQITDINESNQGDYDALITAIDNMRGRTATPLGEGLLEITRYFEGKSSLYETYSGNYISPIQYRCQKNFAIIITDGEATGEDNLPGSGKNALSYTARDRDGKAVSKDFTVCTNSNSTIADGTSVTCPDNLEGSSASTVFGDTNNRSRAVRDVAMYANVADLRVGGKDLDGVDFDDPKFSKQNLNTYTIGFSVNNPVLPAAAEVGGGKYYTAGDEISLGNALKNAVSNIKASTSNAGGVATLSEVTKAGNILYQPVFNPNGWYGELRCFMLDTTATNGIGSSCGKQKAEIPAAENRIIISNKVEKAADTAPPKTTIFSFAATTDTLSNMTEVQRAALGADQKSQLDTINFLRGGTVNGMRTRSNGLLGDIIDGQPTVIGEPSGLNSNPGYLAYQATNKNRKFVLIGANDGMLHAFNGSDSDMGEIMGYIPSAVYSHLQTLTAQNYGQSASAPHTYHVNGASRQMDLRVGNTDWRTYMVGGLGQGGKGFHALDVSDAKTLASTAAVKWEWTDVSDSDMGYSFSTPLIYNVRTSATGVTTAAIFANGYENKFSSGAPNTSALYIVNAVTGDLIKKITVPDSTGLSSPAGVDFGQDGILDYVYAGDLNGQLWRFDLTAESPTSFHVVSKPIFIAQNSAGVTQPITMRPSVKPVNHADESPAGNLILLGTGKLLTDADRADTSTQTIYGVLDEMDDAPLTLKRIDLLTQTITDTVAVSEAGYRTGTYRKVSNHSLDLTKKVKTQKGWLLDLPLSSERVVASPLLFDDKVLFATGIPKSEQKCLPSGKGWIMGLNPMTGSVTQSRTGKDYSFTDIMLDNKSTVADQVSFPSGASYASGFEKDGIPTELSYVAAASKIVSSSSKDSGYGESGHVIALREANSMGIYIGNAKSGTHTGIPMPMPGSTGVGDIYSGAIGDSKVNKDTLLGPSSSTRVSTSLWREIK